MELFHAFILIAQIVSICIISSLIILGKLPHEIMAYPQPLRHCGRMLLGIFMIAPRRVTYAVSWVAFLSIVMWFALIEQASFWTMVFNSDGLTKIVYDFVLVFELLVFIAATFLLWNLRQKIGREIALDEAGRKAYYRIYGQFDMNTETVR